MPRDVAAFHTFVNFDESAVSPSYYAALCGFHDLVQHPIVKYLQDVNASGGHYVRLLAEVLQGSTSRWQIHIVITVRTRMFGAPQLVSELSGWSRN